MKFAFSCRSSASNENQNRKKNALEQAHLFTPFHTVYYESMSIEILELFNETVRLRDVSKRIRAHFFCILVSLICIFTITLPLRAHSLVFRGNNATKTN